MSNDCTTKNIAVIMSTYAEKPEWLKASIESILNQTFDDFRFYIALDSPENHELNAMVKSYAAADPRIVVVANERNLGLVETLNRLLMLVREPYVARMDADDIARPERLQRELDYLEENALDMVMCGADILSHGRIVPGRRLPDIAPDGMAEIQKHTNVSFHSSWLVKQTVYQALDGYRPMNRCEDFDFVLRALQTGFRIGRMTEMLMIYRLAENGISNANWMEQELNARYLQEKFKAGARLSAVLPDEVNGLTLSATQAERDRYASAKASYDDLFASVESRKLLRTALVALKGVANPIFRKKMRHVLAERRAVARICKGANE